MRNLRSASACTRSCRGLRRPAIHHRTGFRIELLNCTTHARFVILVIGTIRSRRMFVSLMVTLFCHAIRRAHDAPSEAACCPRLAEANFRNMRPQSTRTGRCRGLRRPAIHHSTGFCIELLDCDPIFVVLRDAPRHVEAVLRPAWPARAERRAWGAGGGVGVGARRRSTNRRRRWIAHRWPGRARRRWDTSRCVVGASFEVPASYDGRGVTS